MRCDCENCVPPKDCPHVKRCNCNLCCAHCPIEGYTPAPAKECGCGQHCRDGKHGTCCHCFQCSFCKEFGDNYWLNSHLCNRPSNQVEDRKVEETINHLAKVFSDDDMHCSREYCTAALRELVALVRQEKK